MKSSSSFVKILTLSGFTLLIVCFVCYRVGAFDNFSFSNSPISENNFDVNANGMAVDTPIVAKDSIVIVERDIMPSSKMMIMPKITKTDTIKKTTKTDTVKKPIKKSNHMSSSKSGIIYEPEPTPDTTTKPKK